MLLISTIFLTACQTNPTILNFNWSFEETKDGTKACLKEDDVLKLREILIRCENK